MPLTSDLDEISNQLFSLKTDGGNNEYCGEVIQRSVKNWIGKNLWQT